MWRRVWDSNPRAQRANGFQDFSCYGNIPPDRGFYATLSNADFAHVIGEIGVLRGAICDSPQAVGRIVSNVFSNKILEKTLEDFDELWGVATRIVGCVLALAYHWGRLRLCRLRAICAHYSLLRANPTLHSASPAVCDRVARGITLSMT